MRRPRLKAPVHHKRAFYHCVSRIVNREFVLHEEEKEQFVSYMRTYERLYGLRVLTYCIMSNHFHILIEVPQRPSEEELPNDDRLVAHVRKHLGEAQANELQEKFKLFNAEAREELREKWFSRMWDVSSFMKVLKQRFTQWFNGKHGRRGTLWEDRFRSSLVQGESHALKAMAAYIDLNPVRANLCDDPKDYRWSGYGEAVGKTGSKEAKDALQYLTTLSSHGGVKPSSHQPKSHRAALEMWRRFLFGLPEDERSAQERKKQAPSSEAVTYRRKISREKALEVLEKGGRLTEAEYLRCKVRYFCDGAAIGAKSFVEDVFESNRERFGETRKNGARPLRGLLTSPEPNHTQASQPPALFTLRNLQKNVFS